jgi:hypothetical protein
MCNRQKNRMSCVPGDIPTQRYTESQTTPLPKGPKPLDPKSRIAYNVFNWMTVLFAATNCPSSRVSSLVSSLDPQTNQDSRLDTSSWLRCPLPRGQVSGRPGHPTATVATAVPGSPPRCRRPSSQAAHPRQGERRDVGSVRLLHLKAMLY